MADKKIRVLVVDDEAHQREILKKFLESLNYQVTLATSGEEAIKRIESEEPGFRIVFSDLSMPGMDGIELMTKAKSFRPDLDFILVTAHGTIELATKAIKAGAHDFLTKPIEFDEVAHRIRQLLTLRDLEAKTNYLEEENRSLRGGIEIVAESPVMKSLIAELDRVTQTDATVLLTGETGSGKEVMARYLHERSARSRGPFVAVNCSAIPENLLESEFFGHEKGAFTGADHRVVGCFERANKGTLLLDEIGEMDLRMQPKILRALQERNIRRVGGQNDVEIDVRFVAATNKDLMQMVSQGKFREDLYFRLNVVQVGIPPLRERRQDIPALVKSFSIRHAKPLNAKVDEIESSYLECLMNYPFPGNIRELGNIVERSMIYMTQHRLSASVLPAEVKNTPETKVETKVDAQTSLNGSAVVFAKLNGGGNFNEIVSAFEKRLLEEMLEKNNNDVDMTASDLGMARSTLSSKLSKRVKKRDP